MGGVPAPDGVGWCCQEESPPRDTHPLASLGLWGLEGQWVLARQRHSRALECESSALLMGVGGAGSPALFCFRTPRNRWSPRTPGLWKGVWAELSDPVQGSLSACPHPPPIPRQRAALLGLVPNTTPRAQARLYSAFFVPQHPPHPEAGTPTQSEELAAWPGRG